MFLFSRALPALLCLFLLPGCAKTSKEKILGVWQETDGRASVVEFFGNGTYQLRLKAGNIQNINYLEGTWAILPQDRLSIEISQGGKSLSFNVGLSFKDGEMVFLEESGKITRHRRLKDESSK